MAVFCGIRTKVSTSKAAILDKRPLKEAPLNTVGNFLNKHN